MPSASTYTMQEGDDDVPVNKQTSFNGRLNQYFHTSKHISNNIAATVTQGIILPSEPKRKPESTSSSDPSNNDESHSEPTSKRRRKGVPNPLRPTRVTRSQSDTSSPVTTQRESQSPITQPSADSSPPRPRSRRRPPSSRTSTPTPPTSSTDSLLRDTIPPNLTLLLVGVNPGVMTGVTGYAYAHPSNLFWKLLHSSGITTIRHPPSDTYRLPELYNVGNTNIVERPTRDASMLSKAEMDAGVPVLEAKVASQRPEAVCLVGKSIWEAVWRVRRGRAIRKEEFRYGWQDESENMGQTDGWKGAPVFVATTTSGLAAGMTMAQKEAVWNELGKWVVSRREAMKTQDGLDLNLTQ